MFYLIKAVTFIGVFSSILAALPQLDLPPQVVTAVSIIFSAAYLWNHIVDIDSLIFVFFASLFFEGIMLGWRATQYLLYLVK